MNKVLFKAEKLRSFEGYCSCVFSGEHKLHSMLWHAYPDGSCITWKIHKLHIISVGILGTEVTVKVTSYEPVIGGRCEHWTQ